MATPVVKDFANPDSRYRGKPFWAWNGPLEPEELRRQVRIMKRMGLGGFFMHSRVGLDTPYLQKEWFECVDACVDEAKKQKMEAWLYDEDRWPSGAAGGLVTRNPRFRRRAVVLETLKSGQSIAWGGDTVAVFSARIDGITASEVTRLSKGARPPKGHTVLRFHMAIEKPNEWYNDQTYLDTMNHEAVREFIKVTHAAYKKNNGTDFGGVIPGIFTDEPNYGSLHGRNEDALPWTGALPATFRKRHGYTVTDHLPSLFYNTEGPECARARYDYVETITFLFVDAFSRQIGEWCDKNGIQSTGHLLSEQDLIGQTSVVGACMPHYEYMQAPGMDLLTQYNREYDTAKQVSSVAHQFGRKWRLTETYGCTGWDFPFEGHKALGDWQAALGINLRCQHLSWYTMLGQAKRDYPAGIFYQSPWWDLYPKVEDYFARIGAATTKGEEVRDVLVIHPIESMWLHIVKGYGKSKEAGRLDRMIVKLRDTLLAANIDFDYGDETILSRHGKVSRGKGGTSLKVAKAAYTVVVVPPLQTIRLSTVKLLEAFVKAGGTVIQAGAPAGLVDALPSKAARNLARACLTAPASGDELARAVGAFGRRLSITDAGGHQIPETLYLLREDRSHAYLFVVNTGHDFRKQSSKVTHDIPVRNRNAVLDTVTISGFDGFKGAPIELDPDTGEEFAARATRTGDTWTIRTSLPRLGTRLFVVPKAASRARLPERPVRRTVSTRTLNHASWQVQLSEPNVLVLDRPACRIGTARERAPEDVLYADHVVRDALGIRHRGGRMVQPWAQKHAAKPRSVPVQLRYGFDIRTVPDGQVALGVEQVSRYAVSVNGTAVDTSIPAGWWVDQSLQTIRIDPSLLRAGHNEIVLSCTYDEYHPGLEIVYLLGEFGVRVSGTDLTLTDRPVSLKTGDWVRQGLPFYSGSVSYLTTVSTMPQKGQRLVLRVPAYEGVAVRVLVDGVPAGTVGWEPNEVDITDAVTREKSTVAIEVIGHRRNSHGPHHQKTKNPGWTGPGNYVTRDWDWMDGYHLVPVGLMAPPVLEVRA